MVRENRVKAKNGSTLVIVVCVSALLMAFALAMLYTAGLLLSRANRRLEQERSYLLAQSFAQVLEQELSLENQVTDKMPPVFMWHTFEDDIVPLENSLMFASALKKAGVNFEYHVFPHGGHGYSLATKETAALGGNEIEPQCEQWMALCKNWIKHCVV